MADKRISQLTDRGTVANSDVVPIVVSGAVTTNKATISSIQTFMQGNLDLGVTSVGITLGSSGTDVSVSGSPVTSSGNITINIPTASATNRGALSSADWSTFNSKQQAITLTTTGTSGASTLVSGTLNIPNYSTDLSGYVTLGTTQTITAQKTFTTSGSSDTMIISHGSGSGFALDVIKAGSGEAIRVQKTSGSGNAMTISGGNFEAGTIVKTGGTSIQFLKADGSVDSSTYLTTGTAASTYVPYSGANSNVDLGSFVLSANNLTANGGLNAGRLELKNASNASTIRTGYFVLSPSSSNTSINFGFSTGASTWKSCAFSAHLLTDNTPTIFSLPSAGGTLAVTSDLGAYLPLAGGTLTGGLNGTSAAFTGAVSGSAVTITATTGIAGDFTNNSSTNETLRARNNGSGNIAAFRNASAEVASITNSGGLTLSGALNGTSAVFSGAGSFSGGASGVGLSVINTTNARVLQMGYSTGSGAHFLQVYDGASFQPLVINNALTLASTGAATFTQTGGSFLIDTNGHFISKQNLDLATAGGRFTGQSARGTMGIIQIDQVTTGADGGRITFLVSPSGSTTPIEAMRITSGGELFWKVTDITSEALSDGGITFRDSTSNKFIQVSTGLSTDALLLAFYKKNGSSVTNTGTISTSGNLTLYNTTSDYRLKEDLQDFNALEKIANLKIYDFAWKADQSRSYGVLAHELAEVLPYSVYGEKDAIQEDEEPKLQQVDYSKIVPILIKAIQEQQEQINQLKNQINK